jgi:hypothetical protein
VKLQLQSIGQHHEFDRAVDGNIPLAARRWTDSAAIFMPGAVFERDNLKPEIPWNPGWHLRE